MCNSFSSGHENIFLKLKLNWTCLMGWTKKGRIPNYRQKQSCQVDLWVADWKNSKLILATLWENSKINWSILDYVSRTYLIKIKNLFYFKISLNVSKFNELYIKIILNNAYLLHVDSHSLNIFCRQISCLKYDVIFPLVSSLLPCWNIITILKCYKAFSLFSQNFVRVWSYVLPTMCFKLFFLEYKLFTTFHEKNNKKQNLSIHEMLASTCQNSVGGLASWEGLMFSLTS